MPLYAYRCTHCGYSFERIQRFNAQPEQKCPECGGKLERPLSAPGLSFKGTGWYVNDYAAKSSAPSAGSKSDGGGSAAEAKPACGGDCGAACPAAAVPASGSTT